MRRRMTYAELTEAIHACSTPDQLDEYIGPSPGGAAAELRVTRQRVATLVSKGKLDLLEVGHTRRGIATSRIITNASIRRWKRTKAMSTMPSLPFSNRRARVS